ncbi:MAG: DUF4956 domain-containing protein [Intrasporangium sp.]|uniref:DUF4956 domain-containing protein n=1 Tax=Intrasporangium sp. TaxID=1925024 RepID=UPI00264A0402|nr:DUF4956 domain-containing protein [Intrasporangium sp.]MDN5795688.1 DUF4956 domain-containing protein [Intrasporangium sp.]
MTTMTIAILTDLIAATVLAVGLYYRRHRRRDLMFAYLALNVGVLAVATALGSAQAGVGLGLGLFGVLSIIRLRSDPISQAEVAYYFSALALGLIAGLAPIAWWATPAFSVLLLTVVVVADHPRWARRSHTLTLTLDTAILDPAELESTVAFTVGGRVQRLDVREVDLVRDVTVLEVVYVPVDGMQPRHTPVQVPSLVAS